MARAPRPAVAAATACSWSVSGCCGALVEAFRLQDRHMQHTTIRHARQRLQMCVQHVVTTGVHPCSSCSQYGINACTHARTNTQDCISVRELTCHCWHMLYRYTADEAQAVYEQAPLSYNQNTNKQYQGILTVFEVGC